MTDIIIDFSKYSSIKVGSPTDVSIIDTVDLGARFIEYSDHVYKQSIACVRNANLLYNKTLSFDSILPECGLSCVHVDSRILRIIGGANNLLVSPDSTNLAMLGDSFNYISILQDYIEVGASVSGKKAFLFFRDNDLQGLEFLSHLPGKMGGLCNMNAGMKEYEIKDSMYQININGEWLSAKDAGLKYRGRDSKGVIFATRFYKKRGFRHALLEVFNNMRSNQPKIASCGSCFKNPDHDYAGRLLELCGLKGFRINAIGFSDKHANFLVNHGGARFSDSIALINLAKDRVLEKSGIMLECEVKIC